jgi:hypothetical protein
MNEQEQKTPIEKLEELVEGKRKILVDLQVQVMLIKAELPSYEKVLAKLKGEANEKA